MRLLSGWPAVEPEKTASPMANKPPSELTTKYPGPPRVAWAVLNPVTGWVVTGGAGGSGRSSGRATGGGSGRGTDRDTCGAGRGAGTAPDTRANSSVTHTVPSEPVATPTPTTVKFPRMLARCIDDAMNADEVESNDGP